MAQGYEQLELDRQLCFALYSASRAVVRAYGPLLDEAGITYPQYLALMVLWDEPDTALTVGELGVALRLDTGTLTPLLKRLEQAGLVARARDAADERRVLVSLTSEGLALRDRVAQVPFELVQRMGIDEATGKRLKRDLQRVIDALG
jgi:MarR family transcriptional regulator, organic hydroperoxide resistance regulator